MKNIYAFTKILYLFFTVLLFFLLLISRSEEPYTVWQHMHPLFMPLFFATTALLVAIIFSSEKVEYKILFIIVHSILSHSFFVIVFPAGKISFQQSVLGVTRRIFDNTAPHGFGGTVENILTRIYNWFGSGNFQSVYSVTFARMFGIDVFWSHLLLLPMLWGIFIPTITFMITKTLGGDEKISALASLLSLAFPLLISWGAISVPNSLGFIFFLGSLYFFLKYLTSPESMYTRLMLIFTFASFVSHFLTGLISFSFLLIAYSLREYEREKREAPSFAKLFLPMVFILSTSLLPFALVCQRFSVHLYTYFSMDKIHGYTITELIGRFLLGDYLGYSLPVMLIHIIGPLIAFIWVIYKLYTTRNQEHSNNTRIYIVFLFLGLLMLWIDYHILNLFMVGVPFREERLWMFRDLLSVPLVALAIKELLAFSRRTISKITSFKLHLLVPITSFRNVKIFLKAITYSALGLLFMMNILMPVVLAGWITLSVNYAYPHISLGIVQTTSYELEAVKYIEKTTNKSYIVICDRWISYAGQMMTGTYNLRAYYFPERNPVGVALFNKIKNNPSPEVMIEAMNYTDAKVTYFIISKLRLGEDEYKRIIKQAEDNNLETYPGGVFYYPEGDEKLRIFYYEEES
ncbi:MAG: hypothetical protein AOA66_0914 [Candidatus Bathyarchaeota archaeon BA2]|nr:MAG: hypothetical protein AOA66_0914 [Candidatus Bathyarchaeota archaeon BA2]